MIYPKATDIIQARISAGTATVHVSRVGVRGQSMNADKVNPAIGGDSQNTPLTTTNLTTICDAAPAGMKWEVHTIFLANTSGISLNARVAIVTGSTPTYLCYDFPVPAGKALTINEHGDVAVVP